MIIMDDATFADGTTVVTAFEEFEEEVTKVTEYETLAATSRRWTREIAKRDEGVEQPETL